jgi:hypothetical protein
MMQDTRIDPRLAGLIHPNGEPIRLNKQTFVAVADSAMRNIRRTIARR